MAESNASSPQPIELPRSILVRGVNWLGDAVMTMPALARIRERWPNAEISLLTQEKIADLWLNHPAVNHVIPVGEKDGPWATAKRIRTHYRSGKRLPCDVALILPNSPRSALETWLAGIPRRIGYARPWRNWMLTQRVRERPGHVKMHKRSAAEVRNLISTPSHSGSLPAIPESAHQMHDYLHLATFLGADPAPLAPAIPVPISEVGSAAHKFGLRSEYFEHVRPIFGLNPSAQYGPAKRWPLDRFVTAATEIQRATRCRWIIFGAGADQLIAEEISKKVQAMLSEQTHYGSEFVPPLNVAGRTTLRELCALFKLCRVLLTNDSGPMHVAAAVGTPLVVPFGSTSPGLTGPGLPGETRNRALRAPVPCAPCFRRECPIDFRCMMNIGCDEVVRNVLDIAGTH